MRPVLAAAVAVPVVLAGCAVAARRSLRAVTVTGMSMEPVLIKGSRVLVRRARRCRRGDIALLVLDTDAMPMLKRVVAVAGDRLSPTEAGEYPGVEVASPVPPGLILVRGTGPDSFDSRRIGYVPVRAVRGVVVAGRRR